MLNHVPKKKKPALRLALLGWDTKLTLLDNNGFRVLAHRANAARAHEFADQVTVFHHLDPLHVGSELPVGLPV
jgi:hypothetical protein